MSAPNPLNDYAGKSPEWLLKNLLALIHRDGGHFTQREGLAKSCEAAESTLKDFFKSKDAGKRTRR